MDSSTNKHHSLEVAIELNPLEAKRQKERRRNYLNTIQIPFLRTFGFAIILLLVFLHNTFILNSFSTSDFIRLSSLFVAYNVFSWAILHYFFRKSKSFDLGFFFLTADIFAFTLAVYFSGGSNSWLFVLLLVHVADQTNTNFRRVIFFLFVAVANYFGMLGFIELKGIEPINWKAELVKISFLSGLGFHIALSTKTAEALRNRTKASIEMAKGLIQQLKDKSKEVDEANKQAEELSRVKVEFLANMSHEIRTPMNAIIGMTDLVMGTDLNYEQKSLLKVVQSSSETLLKVVNDILDFSKIEEGLIEIEENKFNIRESIESICEKNSFKAHAKGLEFVCDIGNDIPVFVKGDSNRLYQVIANLVDNAIKFTNKGEVVIKANAKKFDAQNKKVRFHFAISDTGIGIPKNKQSSIFERFAQADTSMTRKYGGTGLGLSTSKSLLELMGGRIWFESEENKGTIFYFEIDLTYEDDKKLKLVCEDFKNYPVLLADGNQTSLAFFRKTLTNLGFEVEDVPSGNDVIGALNAFKGKFKLLIIDQKIPSLNGIDTVKFIRNELKINDLKILLLSSLAEIDMSLIDELAISDVVTKPIEQENFFNILVKTIKEEIKINYQLVEAQEQNNNKEIIVTETVENLPEKKAKILLVEDNLDNQNLAKKVLEKKGYFVEVAENGLIGFEAVKRFHYDLVLMDIQMPVMGGFEATQAIRDWERKNNEERIPILALTAHAFDGYREKCLENGMDDYLTKPLKKTLLFQLLDKWLDVRPSIMIVDDSIETLNFISNFFKKDNLYKIITVDNGQRAIEILLKKTVSLILLDMEMPVMNGYDVLKSIRSLSNGKTVPIVSMLSNDSEIEINNCLVFGANDCLTKPLIRRHLLEISEKYAKIERPVTQEENATEVS
ncbi:response regulator [bacterium]|nr:response regulator [bacterium]